MPILWKWSLTLHAHYNKLAESDAITPSTMGTSVVVLKHRTPLHVYSASTWHTPYLFLVYMYAQACVHTPIACTPHKWCYISKKMGNTTMYQNKQRCTLTGNYGGRQLPFKSDISHPTIFYFKISDLNISNFKISNLNISSFVSTARS